MDREAVRALEAARQAIHRVRPALATAQEIGAPGRDFIAASVAGYETGIRIGEFLGRSHYRFFHTTGTAGTVAAAIESGVRRNESWALSTTSY